MCKLVTFGDTRSLANAADHLSALHNGGSTHCSERMAASASEGRMKKWLSDAITALGADTEVRWRVS